MDTQENTKPPFRSKLSICTEVFCAFKNFYYINVSVKC